jgi:hypothetical protein
LITEDDLCAAANTIDVASDTDLRSRFNAIRAARKARTQLDVIRQGVETDSLELTRAAYQLGMHSQLVGDLHDAARWYRVAAVNSFPGASLRLAMVLDSLAEECLPGKELPAPEPQSRNELNLVEEAARWYINAFAAGETEAAELLDILVTRHDPFRPAI